MYSRAVLELPLMEAALRSCVDIESLMQPHQVDFDKHKLAHSKQSPLTDHHTHSLSTQYRIQKHLITETMHGP